MRVHIYLIGISLVLGFFTACQKRATPPDRVLPSEPASALALSPTPDLPPAEQIPSTAEREACLGPPLSPGIEQLAEVDGLRHVAGNKEHLFLPERPGKDRLTADGMDVVAQRIKTKLGTQSSYGLGLCGSDRAYRAFRCVWLTVPICEPWLDEVRSVAPVAKAEGLGIVVEIQGRTKPRCLPAEPNCGPLPYHEAITDAQQETRNWSGAFTLPLWPDLETKTLRHDLSAGSCEHSGHCVRAGCGNNCDAWYKPVYAAGCPGFMELADAYCGCVEGQCAWFAQPETVRLIAQAKVQGWQGDIPRQEPPQPATADALFERRLSDPWMLRQMRRLAPSYTLPQHIEFSLTWHPKAGVTALTLRADGQPGPAWLVTLFEHLRMPTPEVTPFRPVQVEGTLRVLEDTTSRD